MVIIETPYHLIESTPLEGLYKVIPKGSIAERRESNMSRVLQIVQQDVINYDTRDYR